MENNNSQDPQAPRNVFSPAGARTANSVAILWDRPRQHEQAAGYEVYCDGKSVASVAHCDFTMDGLLADTAYTVTIRAKDVRGVLSAPSGPLQVRTRPSGPVLDVTAFGAKGDGVTMNTKAIQSAIDACGPHGIVLAPRGVFLTGAVFLKSDMTLMIEEGGKILGSPDPADYPIIWDRTGGRERQIHASLINAGELRGPGVHNVAVTGRGKIDANGVALAAREEDPKTGKDLRGKVIGFRNAQDVYLEGVTVLQSPCWCVHFVYCRGVSVNRVKVMTYADEQGRLYKGIHNGDGVNPDSSRDVCIFNCDISSQDDCIAIKSGFNEEGRRIGRPSENIRVTNCRFRSGFGVVMGSEMSGGVRNVLVEDCTFEDVAQVCQIKTPRGRGGVVENIVVRDVRHFNRRYNDTEWFCGGICLDAFYAEKSYPTGLPPVANDGTPAVRKVVLENIRLSSPRGRAILIRGLPEMPYRDIRLTNITAEGKTGLYGENVENVHLENVKVTSQQGDAFEWKSARNVEVK